jgi:hypothetical protein
MGYQYPAQMADDVGQAEAAMHELTERHADLSFRKLIINGVGFAAQFIYEPNGSYQKWFTTRPIPTLRELVDELCSILEDDTMANIFKMTGDLFKFMTAEMLPTNKDTVLTIQRVVVEELENQRGKQERPVIFFKETDKGMVLGNKTNVRQMVKLLGSETDDWIGKRVALFRVEISAFGKMQPVIRLRDFIPQAPKSGKKVVIDDQKADTPVTEAAGVEQGNIDWGDLEPATRNNYDSE